MNKYTLLQIIDWAASKNCDIEKTGRKYEVWNKDDHSITDTCSTLQEVIDSIQQLGNLIDHGKNYSQEMQDDLEPIE